MTEAKDKKVLLEIHELNVRFPIRTADQMPWAKPKQLKAVNGVTLRLHERETIGVVGESGCGKSTLARAVIGLVPAHSGSIVWLGRDLTTLNQAELREQRKSMQMIFQDPLASLNPRMTIGDIIAEPLTTFYPEMPAKQVQAKVVAIMEKVGLLQNQINRYPHEFSGGQCQRIDCTRFDFGT